MHNQEEILMKVKPQLYLSFAWSFLSAHVNMVATGSRQTFSYLKLTCFPLVFTFSKITQNVLLRKILIFFYRMWHIHIFSFSTVIFIYFSWRPILPNTSWHFKLLRLSTKCSYVVTSHKCMIAWKCSIQRVS